MSTLSELLAEHTELIGSAGAHLQRVVAEWQLLADLSFADLQLWVHSQHGSAAASGDDAAQMVCVAQCRPNTAPTVFPVDVVGTSITVDDNPQVFGALASGRILREEDPTWVGSVAIRREAVPVRFDGAVIAVLARAINLTQPRLPSPLEVSYQDCANDLCQMVSEGTFPQYEGNPRGLSTPRVGDGLIRVDEHGVVQYASPNALSAYHRMGWNSELGGNDLADVTVSLLTDPFESEEAAAMLRAAVAGEAGMRIEADAHRATVLIRAVPLRPRGALVGAVVLVRDVTEVKRRDLALISKDATIREIHHRVKNNLQSVSALLRLQARRTSNAEAKHALGEAVRRVASIALVHELLSGSVDEEVDLDVVIDQLVPVMADVASGGSQVTVRRIGKIGVLKSDLAMPMVMVLTELIQNAVEHGFAPEQSGRVLIDTSRSTRELVITVHDNGIGLPDGFDPAKSDRLGLQIVHTLVQIELSGQLELRGGPQGGTDAVLTVPLR
ncbi:sensor histidine kinase [Williamsia soli]|uniref:sensor histidine kinase n=1 Tax=Williamsia soli TaxID=364929 RepID=UPI001A9D5BB4|nr:PAS domain-containing sensor histidine kinase [Williamsia soli]